MKYALHLAAITTMIVVLLLTKALNQMSEDPRRPRLEFLADDSVVGKILQEDFNQMELERKTNSFISRISDKPCGHYAQHERYVTLKKRYPKYREGISDRYFDHKVAQALTETAEPFVKAMYVRLSTGRMPRCLELDSKVMDDLRDAMEAIKFKYDKDLLRSLYTKAIRSENSWSISILSEEDELDSDQEFAKQFAAAVYNAENRWGLKPYEQGLTSKWYQKLKPLFPKGES